MVFEKVRPVRGPQAPAGPFARGGRRRTIRIALIPAGVLLAVLLVAAAVALLSGASAFNIAPATTGQWRPALVGVLVLVAAAALVLLADRRPRAGGVPGAAVVPTRRGRIAWWGFVAVCFAVQLVLAHAVLQFPPWDAAQIFEVAYHVAVAPEPRLFSVGDQSAYFALYPNNAFLVAAFAVLFGALRLTGLTGIEQYLWASVVVNCVALTASFVLLRTVVRRLVPGRATVVPVVLGVVLVIVSPWLNVAYSDTLAMLFPIGMLALWLAWPADRSVRSSALLFVLLGVLCGIGVAIKPPVLFMGIALLVATVRGVPAGRRRDLRGPAVAVIGAFVVGLGVTHVVASGITDAIVPQLRSTTSMPFTHYMAMGSTGDGGFNADDFNRTFALPAGARAKAGLFLYADRVIAMGPVGYPLFLAEKMLYALSDGSFFQDREGVGPYDRSYFGGDPLSLAVQSVFPLGSPLHGVLSSSWQASWWLALLLCLVPLRRLRFAKHGVVLAMRVSLLLLLAFLCLSESRSRYLYHYLPVVLVLAGLGTAALTAEVGAFRSRRALKTAA